jgi:hypothetical protein
MQFKQAKDQHRGEQFKAQISFGWKLRMGDTRVQIPSLGMLFIKCRFKIEATFSSLPKPSCAISGSLRGLPKLPFYLKVGGKPEKWQLT